MTGRGGWGVSTSSQSECLEVNSAAEEQRVSLRFPGVSQKIRSMVTMVTSRRGSRTPA